MDNDMKTWTLDVKHEENGDAILEFPPDLLEEAGWKEGDRIKWIDRGDGSWLMEKIETQLVLVECINQFRQRYVVEVPTGVDAFGKDKAEWALDTVTMEEAKEFSQEHLGETIVSHRVLTHDEVIKLCDKDNDYCKDWPNDKKVEVFVTEWNDADR
jgi:bifunctional DNA-binding transcriptional regulator/antitoxin component of YhaV-PrlF toxin-antitoxin module